MKRFAVLGAVPTNHAAHIKRLSYIITACANFSANYNFQSIAVALLVMSVSECTSSEQSCKEGKQSNWVVTCASGAIFAGAVMGQLSMGYYGDRTTRNYALFVTLCIACFGSCMTAIAPSGSPSSVYGVIVAFRFVTGYGLGGIYPLSATKSAEDDGDNNTSAALGGGKGGGVNVVSSSWAFFWQTPGKKQYAYMRAVSTACIDCAECVYLGELLLFHN
jgi:MFS family permease